MRNAGEWIALKNGFGTAQKSFSLPVSLHILMINHAMLSPISERRKTFDSPLTNHFSAVMQSSRTLTSSNGGRILADLDLLSKRRRR